MLLALPVIAVLPAMAAAPVAKSAPAKAPGQGSPSYASAADAAAAEALAANIRAAVTALPAGASTEDLEAAITFAVSQANASDAVMTKAFDSLQGSDSGQVNFPIALERVRLAMKKKGRGTGALSDGFGFSNFSIGLAPGGGSNYAQ
jgi:hypothetical protein